MRVDMGNLYECIVHIFSSTVDLKKSNFEGFQASFSRNYLNNLLYRIQQIFNYETISGIER